MENKRKKLENVSFFKASCCHAPLTTSAHISVNFRSVNLEGLDPILPQEIRSLNKGGGILFNTSVNGLPLEFSWNSSVLHEFVVRNEY